MRELLLAAPASATEGAGAEEMRLVAAARAMSTMDTALRMLRSQCAEFGGVLPSEWDAFALRDARAFEERLANEVSSVGAGGSRAGWEDRVRKGRAAEASRSAWAWARRSAQLWQPRRATLRLSAVRLPLHMSLDGEARVLRDEAGIFMAAQWHWMLVFAAPATGSPFAAALLQQGAGQWDLRRLRPPARRIFVDVLGGAQYSSSDKHGFPARWFSGWLESRIFVFGTRNYGCRS